MDSDVKILIVDDEPNVVQAFQRQLRKKFRVDVATSGPAALNMMETSGPYGVVVSDMRMPGMNGLQLLQRVKQKFPQSIRIMLTGNVDHQTVIDAVNEGSVFRFLTKPCSTEAMAGALTAGLDQFAASSVQNLSNCLKDGADASTMALLCAGDLLVQANQKLQRDLANAKSEIERRREQADRSRLESRSDGLTGLNNRRAFDAAMKRALLRHRRDGSPLCLMMFDIDHFKSINDRYGHVIGDRVLKSFAKCILSSLRGNDFVARYGGEEFAAILFNTSLQDASAMAARVLRTVEQNCICIDGTEISITTSIGIGQIHASDDVLQIVAKADAALYAAKRAGRNCAYYHDITGCTTAS